MTDKERIESFNNKNYPIWLSGGEGKPYCLAVNSLFLEDTDEIYNGYAFEKYLKSHVPSKNEYGTGYDWEVIFKRAFCNEKRLREIDFDSEMGGFYCYANDLSLVEELGVEFKKICDNKEVFQILLDKALSEAEKMSVEQLLKNEWDSNFTIQTPDGEVYITGEDRNQLLKKTKITIEAVKDTTKIQIDAYELLSQRIEKLDKVNQNPPGYYATSIYPDMEEFINPEIYDSDYMEEREESQSIQM